MLIFVSRSDLSMLLKYLNIANGGRHVINVLTVRDAVTDAYEYRAILYFDNYGDYEHFCTKRKRKPIPATEFFK
jgi:hypothetical protein